MAGREVAFGGGGGGGPNQTKKLKISSRDDSIFSCAPSNSFTGSRAMVSFGAIGGVNGSGNSFYQSFDPQENGDEYFDDYFNQPEKKKRLSLDQVQFLEKSFELENKLEPERKTQLANELGLQPRQIAVWFQNRRARWKTKQTETEYETLHASYKSLKTDYDSLLKENEKLKAQVLHLKHNGLAQDTENANSRLCGTTESSEAMPNEALADTLSIGGGSTAPAASSKNDEQNSARSDVTNADSPGLIDATHPLLVESGDSSHVFEPGHMDLSHNGDDCLNEELLQHAYLYPNVNSCGYGFAVEDHALGFWSC